MSNMNNKLHKAFLSFLLLFSISTLPSYSLPFQQNNAGVITGRIISTGLQPIHLALVSIEGTAIGDYTNEQGEYKLSNVPGGTQTIIVSGLGIKSKKVPVKVIANGVTKVPDIEIDNSTNLEQIVVIGKSEARKQQEQAYAITVLDARKMYNSIAPIGKLLNNVSSVKIREDGGVGSNYSFSLNGFSGNQVKFFLDGIPMDNFGSSFNLSNISINMTERVDVYKGVLPVDLGADALGGAVNIITRKDANYLDASYSVGSFNTHKAALNGAYTDLKSGFTIRANGFFNFSDNNYKVYVPIVQLNTNQRIDEQWRKRFHDQYTSGGIKLETGITGKSYADYLLAGFIWTKNDKDIQTGATMDAVYGGVKAKGESIIPSVRYKKSDLLVEGLSVSLYGAYSMVNAFNIDTLSQKYNWLGEWVPTASHGEYLNTDSKIKNREWLANANLNYMIDTHQSITVNHVFSSGNRKIHDKVDPDNESNKIPQELTKNITGLGWLVKYDRWNSNVFGKMYNFHSTSLKILDRFTDNERLEKLLMDNTNFGYGAAITFFILPKLQAKASYEHSYRLPESNEMFGDGLIQQANPDLKPERSDNVNFGFTFEQQIKQHSFYLEANAIYRNARDFIRKGVSLTSNPTTGYENLGNVRTTGAEGGIKYRWKDLIHAGANITWQNIRDYQRFEENTSYVGEGIIEHITYKERIPNIPYLFGHGDLGVQLPDIVLQNSALSLDYSFDWVKKYYLSFPGLGAKSSKKVIPTQISHDISLGYAMEKGKYNVIFECTNFTNQRLYDNYKLQKPGRTFNLKFRYFLHW
jgi:outer membrane receptor protein involved in Fe transport